MPYPDRVLAEDEEVVRHLHPHWLTLFRPVLWLLVVVGAASFGLAVRSEVLDAGNDLVRCAVVGALVAVHPRCCHRRAQIRVFTSGLGYTTPARVVRHVHHRAVHLLDSGRRGLAGTEGSVGFSDRWIEAAGLCQRDREHRAETVDGVEGEQDRDVQPRLLDRDVLEVVDLRWIREAEDAADPVARLIVGRLEVGEQLHLLQLLVERHLAEQRVHA